MSGETEQEYKLGISVLFVYLGLKIYILNPIFIKLFNIINQSHINKIFCLI